MMITQCVGNRYRDPAEKEAFLNLAAGDTLYLEREPDNAHDPNAIRIYAQFGDHRFHIGYVPAAHATGLATMMDEGTDLLAMWDGNHVLIKHVEDAA